jgi:hypothetical protein
MAKVFIIGNGPSAISKKLGGHIDAADVVVRLNDFKVVGFEEFVGRKTDILFTCRLNEYQQNLHSFQEVILCLLMNPLDGVTIPDSVLQSPNIVRQIDWPEAWELAKILSLRVDCYPTTGMMAVIYAMQRFGHVYLVGFDGMGGGNRHYYENGKRATPTRHDGDREREWLNIFERLGFLTDLSRADSPDFYKFDGHDPFIQSISITQ